MFHVTLRTTLGVLAAMLVSLANADPGRTTSPLTTEGVLQRETSAGDLIADAVRQAGSAQVALVNATQFKSGTLPAGKVVAGDVSGLLVKPTRPWVVSSLSGKALKLALERSLSRAPDANAHFLQVSGLVVRYDPQAPAGARVTDLQIGDAPCQDATRYRVAMPDDLAKGGSGYFTIAEFSEASILPGATGALAEAIAAFLEANATLDYGTATRILTITR